jgi:tetratricopeptide (TPR) repeat protein
MSDGVAAAALLCLAPSCALILLTLPRPVSPFGLPGLRLDSRQIARVLANEQAVARISLKSAPAAELKELFLAEGRAERALEESPGAFQVRRDRLRRALAQLRQIEGEKAVAVLRAQAVGRLQSALDLALPKAQAEQVLGSFANFLQRYRATVEGNLVAPLCVVRTMYKGRWNLIHELPPTYGFVPVERLAYYGWLALYADGAPLALRKRALEAYESDGGRAIAEAKGVLFFLDRQYEQAVDYLQLAYRRHPTLRLRNYLLGAQKAAGI